MANHYHILFQTARANLVDGMKWLQTAYTQRFNARHRMRGHLFAGRYHAMVVEADNAHYFSTIIDYIHLNPARSGLARRHTFLSGCKWTSLPAWLDSPAKRPKWIHPERGLVCFGCDDTEDGRQKYLNHLMGRFEAERMDERSLLPAGHVGPGTVQRGWCYGSSAFRARLVGGTSPAGAQKARHDGDARIGDRGIPGGNHRQKRVESIRPIGGGAACHALQSPVQAHHRPGRPAKHAGTVCLDQQPAAHGHSQIHGNLAPPGKKNGGNGFENEGVDRAPELLTSVPPTE